MHPEALLKALDQTTFNWLEYLELLALRHHMKRIVRFTAAYSQLNTLKILAEELALHAQIAPFHLEPVFANGLCDQFSRIAPGAPEPGQEGVIFFGSEPDIERAISLESNGCSALETARHYGYPECCAANYEKRIQGGEEIWIDSFLKDITQFEILPWQMNRAGRLFAPYLSILPDYFPCSCYCKPSLSLAAAYEVILRAEGLHGLLELVKTHLARPLLLFEGCLYWMESKHKPRHEQEFHSHVIATLPFKGINLPYSELTISQSGRGLFIAECQRTDQNAKLVFFE